MDVRDPPPGPPSDAEDSPEEEGSEPRGGLGSSAWALAEEERRWLRSITYLSDALPLDDDDNKEEEEDLSGEPDNFPPKPIFRDYTADEIFKANPNNVAQCLHCKGSDAGSLRMRKRWVSPFFQSIFHVRCAKNIWDTARINEEIRRWGAGRVFGRHWWWRHLTAQDREELVQILAAEPGAAWAPGGR